MKSVYLKQITSGNVTLISQRIILLGNLYPMGFYFHLVAYLIIS